MSDAAFEALLFEASSWAKSPSGKSYRRRRKQLQQFSAFEPTWMKQLYRSLWVFLQVFRSDICVGLGSSREYFLVFARQLWCMRKQKQAPGLRLVPVETCHSAVVNFSPTGYSFLSLPFLNGPIKNREEDVLNAWFPSLFVSLEARLRYPPKNNHRP